MAAVIGIDLGTTNTCVAVVENGKPAVIPNKSGYKTTPSIVAFTESGKRLVGQVAKRQVVTNAEHTVTAAKRLIGRKWGSPEVHDAMLACTYRLVEGPHSDVRVELRGQSYSIPELSAFILQEMKFIAESYLGQTVDRAVITVPAYFNDAQRQATKDAGRIAGLEVLRIVNEPTAAALAYGFGRELDRKIAVFDLGGGTFDISILALAEDVFEVIATGGDTFLGGEDFDRRILDWLATGFLEQHGVDLRGDKMAHQRLKDAAEKAKCELSSARETEIDLPFITSVGGQALHLSRTLSREVFEGLTADLIERALQLCQRTLAEANLEAQEIEDVILVGGMTRMPRVMQAVAEFFGREPSRGVHPDEVVALGAAIQGATLVDGDAAGALLLDVTPHALGIMIAGGYYHKLIEKNTTIPVSRSHIFTTVRDNQTSVKILVLQGEGERAEDNELLGEFVLTGLRPAPKGVVEVEVSFDITADGIVSVSARDLESGRQTAITVTATSGLTEDEIGRMMAESRDYLESLRSEEESEQKRQEALRLIAEIEGLWPRVEQAVAGTELGTEALHKAQNILERGRAAVGQGTTQALGGVLQPLEQTRTLFQAVLRRHSRP